MFACFVDCPDPLLVGNGKFDDKVETFPSQFPMPAFTGVEDIHRLIHGCGWIFQKPSMLVHNGFLREPLEGTKGEERKRWNDLCTL